MMAEMRGQRTDQNPCRGAFVSQDLPHTLLSMPGIPCCFTRRACVNFAAEQTCYSCFAAKHTAAHAHITKHCKHVDEAAVLHLRPDNLLTDTPCQRSALRWCLAATACGARQPWRCACIL